MANSCLGTVIGGACGRLQDGTGTTCCGAGQSCDASTQKCVPADSALVFSQYQNCPPSDALDSTQGCASEAFGNSGFSAKSTMDAFCPQDATTGVHECGDRYLKVRYALDFGSATPAYPISLKFSFPDNPAAKTRLQLVGYNVGSGYVAASPEFTSVKVFPINSASGLAGYLMFRPLSLTGFFRVNLTVVNTGKSTVQWMTIDPGSIKPVAPIPPSDFMQCSNLAITMSAPGGIPSYTTTCTNVTFKVDSFFPADAIPYSCTGCDSTTTTKLFLFNEGSGTWTEDDNLRNCVNFASAPGGPAFRYTPANSRCTASLQAHGNHVPAGKFRIVFFQSIGSPNKNLTINVNVSNATTLDVSAIEASVIGYKMPFKGAESVPRPLSYYGSEYNGEDYSPMRLVYVLDNVAGAVKDFNRNKIQAGEYANEGGQYKFDGPLVYSPSASGAPASTLAWNTNDELKLYLDPKSSFSEQEQTQPVVTIQTGTLVPSEGTLVKKVYDQAISCYADPGSQGCEGISFAFARQVSFSSPAQPAGTPVQASGSANEETLPATGKEASFESHGSPASPLDYSDALYFDGEVLPTGCRSINLMHYQCDGINYCTPFLTQQSCVGPNDRDASNCISGDTEISVDTDYSTWYCEYNVGCSRGLPFGSGFPQYSYDSRRLCSRRVPLLPAPSQLPEGCEPVGDNVECGSYDRCQATFCYSYINQRQWPDASDCPTGFIQEGQTEMSYNANTYCKWPSEGICRAEAASAYLNYDYDWKRICKRETEPVPAVTITITPSLASVTTRQNGQFTLTFKVDSSVNIQSASYALDLKGGMTVTGTPNPANGVFSVSANSYTDLAFTFNVPSGITPGTYPATLSIYGGNLPFKVVQKAAAITVQPEPTTSCLSSIGEGTVSLCLQGIVTLNNGLRMQFTEIRGTAVLFKILEFNDNVLGTPTILNSEIGVLKTLYDTSGYGKVQVKLNSIASNSVGIVVSSILPQNRPCTGTQCPLPAGCKPGSVPSGASDLVPRKICCSGANPCAGAPAAGLDVIGRPLSAIMRSDQPLVWTVTLHNPSSSSAISTTYSISGAIPSDISYSPTAWVVPITLAPSETRTLQFTVSVSPTAQPGGIESLNFYLADDAASKATLAVTIGGTTPTHNCGDSGVGGTLCTSPNLQCNGDWIPDVAENNCCSGNCVPLVADPLGETEYTKLVLSSFVAKAREIARATAFRRSYTQTKYCVKPKEDVTPSDFEDANVCRDSITEWYHLKTEQVKTDVACRFCDDKSGQNAFNGPPASNPPAPFVDSCDVRCKPVSDYSSAQDQQGCADAGASGYCVRLSAGDDPYTNDEGTSRCMQSACYYACSGQSDATGDYCEGSSEDDKCDDCKASGYKTISAYDQYDIEWDPPVVDALMQGACGPAPAKGENCIHEVERAQVDSAAVAAQAPYKYFADPATSPFKVSMVLQASANMMYNVLPEIGRQDFKYSTDATAASLGDECRVRLGLYGLSTATADGTEFRVGAKMFHVSQLNVETNWPKAYKNVRYPDYCGSPNKKIVACNLFDPFLVDTDQGKALYGDFLANTGFPRNVYAGNCFTNEWPVVPDGAGSTYGTAFAYDSSGSAISVPSPDLRAYAGYKFVGTNTHPAQLADDNTFKGIIFSDGKTGVTSLSATGAYMVDLFPKEGNVCRTFWSLGYGPYKMDRDYYPAVFELFGHKTDQSSPLCSTDAFYTADLGGSSFQFVKN
ncbi:MAG: hypothetical protein V1708_00185 [Candidatus Micrarchaeota archaeon]